MQSFFTTLIKPGGKLRMNNLHLIDVALATGLVFRGLFFFFFLACFSHTDDKKDVQIKRSVLPSVV